MARTRESRKKTKAQAVSYAESNRMDGMLGSEPTYDSEAKANVVGFPGGMNVRLDKDTGRGTTVRDELSQFLAAELDAEIGNHEKLVKNISKWQKQYRGKKKPKSTPWDGCANTAVPVTRYIIDTILVRILDSIFNRRKVVIVKPLKPGMDETARQIEDGIDWFQKHILRLREKLTDPLIQQLKVGTGIVNIDWESKKRVVYRPATQDEQYDDNVTKYAYNQSDGKKGFLVKDIQTVYEGPQIFSVPREDFLVSSDAIDIPDAFICGFRKKYRKYELNGKVSYCGWDEEAVKKLTCDRPSDNEQTRADVAGKDTIKTATSDPYEIWHLWCKWDVDGDGEPDDLMVGFHRSSSQILYAKYNPIFSGNRPFVKLVGYPVEYSFDGESGCEAIYPLQEEIDTLENMRLDRLALLNNFVTMSKDGANLDNFKWKTGRHYVVNDVDLDTAFKVVQVPDVSPSTFTEEQFLIAMAEKTLGVTPASMGIQTAERPVFKDTMAMQEEANKKFKSYIDNLRAGLTEIFYQILELFAQYQPTYSWRDGESGEWQTKTMEIPNVAEIRDGLGLDLAASTEMISQEVRRQMSMEKYQMLSDYYSKMMGAVQTLVNPMVPPAFKKFTARSIQAVDKVMRNILQDFETPDVDDILVDPTEVITPQDAMAPPPQAPQAPQGPQGPQPPGGPGGQKPPQGRPMGRQQGPPVQPGGQGMPQGGPPPGMVPAEL